MNLYSYSQKKYGEVFSGRDEINKRYESSESRVKRLKKLEDESSSSLEDYSLVKENPMSGEEYIENSIIESNNEDLLDE